MDQSVEAFWQKFEKDTGEKVLAKTMGQYFESPGDRGDWGLLVLSPSTLRFRRTPGENWFASLFKARGPSVESEPLGDILIPLASIDSVQSPKGKFLDFLFGSPFENFTVEYREGETQKKAHFAVDPKNELLRALRASVKTV